MRIWWGGGDVFDEGGRVGFGELELELLRGILLLFVGGRVGFIGGWEGLMDGFVMVGLSGFDGFFDGGSDGFIDGFVGGGVLGLNLLLELLFRGILLLLLCCEILGGGDVRRLLFFGMCLCF